MRYNPQEIPGGKAGLITIQFKVISTSRAVAQGPIRYFAPKGRLVVASPPIMPKVQPPMVRARREDSAHQPSALGVRRVEPAHQFFPYERDHLGPIKMVLSETDSIFNSTRYAVFLNNRYRFDEGKMIIDVSGCRPPQSKELGLDYVRRQAGDPPLTLQQLLAAIPPDLCVKVTADGRTPEGRAVLDLTVYRRSQLHPMMAIITREDTQEYLKSLANVGAVAIRDFFPMLALFFSLTLLVNWSEMQDGHRRVEPCNTHHKKPPVIIVSPNGEAQYVEGARFIVKELCRVAQAAPSIVSSHPVLILLLEGLIWAAVLMYDARNRIQRAPSTRQPFVDRGVNGVEKDASTGGFVLRLLSQNEIG